MTIFVTVYGISMFYPSPNYEDFCGDAKTTEVITDSAKCVEVGGQWSAYSSEEMGELTGYCDQDYLCRQDYETAREKRAKMVFIISVPLGILIIVLGAFLFNLEAVGAGLMGGGVGTLVYGTNRYWQYGENWFRFILSLLGLGALIFLAYWFNKKAGKKKR